MPDALMTPNNRAKGARGIKLAVLIFSILTSKYTEMVTSMPRPSTTTILLLLIGACASPNEVTKYPLSYYANFTTSVPTIDGRLQEQAWHDAPWTALFVDIQGTELPTPRHQTRAKMCWDDTFLYFGAWMNEPDIWATLTEHDSVIFHDNDFEVFIDPDGDCRQYYEIGINAFNTEWDLRLVETYLNGGPPVNEWEIPGLQKAVWIDGTINDPTDRDHGWSIELAIPWVVLAEFAGKPAPPTPGDIWRVNFSRVEWQVEIIDGEYKKIPDTPEDNWVWSPQFAINMHLPQHWGFVHFVKS